MEFAAAALSAVGSAVSGATAAVGSAVSTVGSALGIGGTAGGGGGSLFSSILQGGASLASVIGALGAGEENAAAYKAKAADAEDEKGLEAVRGIERRDGLRRSLLERLGQQDVAAAASGVDLSFGTPALARDEAARDGERALTQDQNTEDLRANRLGQRADEFRNAARSARRSGVYKAIGAGVQGIAGISRRG